LIVAVGAALFVLPGIVALALFGIVGPVINVEGHGVLPAFRRSAQLVRPKIALGLGLVALPLFLEHAIVHALEGLAWERSPIAASLALATFGVVVASVVGLVVVTLAHELMSRAPHG
jgi:hypothetical protein